jgi:formylglycine-generating enzyme required for sulfatase activity
MTSPTRLAERGTPFEREVLASARIDAGSDEGFQRTVLAMGLGAAALSATTPTAGAGIAAAGGAGAAAGGTTTFLGAGVGVVVKWVGLAVVIAGSATAASVSWVAHETRAPTIAATAPRALEPAASTESGHGNAIATQQPEGIVEPASLPEPSAPPPRPTAHEAITPGRAEVPQAVRMNPTTPERPPLSVPTSLDLEVSALDRVRAALSNHDPSGALRELDAYDRRFPSSLLADEAAVLRVDALIEQGDSAAAVELAEHFLAEHPSSPHAPHLRRLVRENPATVSNFRLDKYEITVGRFRQFVNAVIGGWRPASGSGKHKHLNGGKGLSDSSSPPGTFESGWNPLWNNNLSSTASGWDSELTSQPHGAFNGAAGACGTWTSSVAGNEQQPINCINWYQAYAFCIWDDAFLPSEAEWNYAASGGNEQRVYPWSIPAISQTIDCSYANYGVNGIQACMSDATVLATFGVGSESPKGDGKWAQSDLAGNVFEWALDYYALYAMPCVDCGYLSGASEPVSDRVERGGSYQGSSVVSSYRVSNPPTTTAGSFGARCARTP